MRKLSLWDKFYTISGLTPDYRRQLMIFRKNSKHNLRDDFDLIKNDKDLVTLSKDPWHCKRSQLTCETIFFVQVDNQEDVHFSSLNRSQFADQNCLLSLWVFILLDRFSPQQRKTKS